MRQGEVAQEFACRVQTGCRSDEGPRRESEPGSENAPPDPQAVDGFVRR